MKNHTLWAWVVSVFVMMAGEALAVTATWTNTGNGAVGYWTNNANWSASPCPGTTLGNNASFNTVAGSSYTAILDSTLPSTLGVFYCPDTAGSGSTRVIVTNCVLTLGGADPAAQFFRGFTLQIDAGGVVTNMVQNSGYVWNGSGVTLTINDGGKLYGDMNFGIKANVGMTGLVNSTTSPGGVWSLNNRTMWVCNQFADTNCLLTISGVTMTNFAAPIIWRGAGAAKPAVGNRMIVSNGAKLIQNGGNWNELSRGVGDHDNVMQLGGDGLSSTIDLYGYFVGYASGSYNNTLVMTNATVTMNGGIIGGGSQADSNNTIRILAGATWNAKGSGMSIGGPGAGPNNACIVDGGTVTNIGGTQMGGSWDSAGANGSVLTICNGGTWSGVWGIAVGAYKGSSSNTVNFGGAGARSTVSLTMGQDGRLYLGGQSQNSQTNCNFNTLIVTNASVSTTNTFSTTYDNFTIGWGSASNSASILAGADWNKNGQTLVVGYGLSTAASVGNSLTINRGVLRGVGSVLVGKVSADTGNSVLVADGGLLEVAKAMTIVAGSTGNSISNDAGIYQFTTNNPALTPVALANIAINNGTVSFRGITNADVFCNQGGKPLDSTAKMAWSGANAFRLDSATNTASGQSYTFQPGTATNFVRLELLNSSLYRGGSVAIGPSGTLVISNGVSSIASNLTFDVAATLSMDLSSTNAYSALVAQGDVTLNGCALNINAGTAPIPGSSFSIISNSAGQTSGSFATSSQVMTVNGTNYIFRINATPGGVTVTCNLQTRGLCLIIE